MKRVTIVGLGLIGGSIALALRRACPSIEIVAVDHEGVLDSPRARELVDRPVVVDSLAAPQAASLDADLVILALPVAAVVSVLPGWLELGIPTTDTASTKGVIAAVAAGSSGARWFVPGHPMAGRAQGGLVQADMDLFRGCPWIICPGACDPAALRATARLIDLTGAIAIEMEPSIHDARVALTSHLPQLLASWLLTAACRREATSAIGPAFREMTRTAGGPESMWGDIFATNHRALAELLEDAAASLARLATELRQEPPSVAGCLSLLEEARGADRNGLR